MISIYPFILSLPISQERSYQQYIYSQQNKSSVAEDLFSYVNCMLYPSTVLLFSYFAEYS